MTHDSPWYCWGIEANLSNWGESKYSKYRGNGWNSIWKRPPNYGEIQSKANVVWKAFEENSGWKDIVNAGLEGNNYDQNTVLFLWCLICIKCYTESHKEALMDKMPKYVHVRWIFYCTVK